MATPTVTVRVEDAKGSHRIAIGAGLGVAGALITLLLPFALLWLSISNPDGLFTFNSNLVRDISLLVLAGAILFLLSLFVYRRGFAVLRKVDRRFTVASILCLIGSLGFLLLLVAVVVILGSTNALVTCIGGHPSHALSCLRSGEPLGAYTGLVGFWLGWIGGVGLVLGLASAGRRFSRGILYGSAAAYGLLLLALVGPFVGLIYPVPGAEYLLLLSPLLALLAPGLAYAGTRRPPATTAPA
jgi:hypothetical protein